MIGNVILVDIALFAILLAAALGIAHTRSLYSAAMLAGLFSLTCASLFVVQDAVDVAFTEAAVGAGMSTVLFLGTLALTHSRERVTPPTRRVPALLVAVGTGVLLIYASLDLPPYADPANPVQQHPLTERYLQTSQQEIGVPNVVTAVLASYRGFDTLGEVAVIFTAGVAVLMLLGRLRGNAAGSPGTAPAGGLQGEHRVLRVVAKLLMPFILLFALYVQFHGDFGPGGGFQAGVIFAAGIVLYTLVFGLGHARAVVTPGILRMLLPLGLLLYAGVGVATLLLGGAFLDYNALSPQDPVQGQHLGILLVEAGVGITVAAAMILLFYAFAGRGARS